MKAEGQAGRVTSSFILHPSSFGRGAHLQRKLHQTRGGGAFSGIGWRGGVRPDVRNECAASFQGDSTNSELTGCSPPRRWSKTKQVWRRNADGWVCTWCLVCA